MNKYIGVGKMISLILAFYFSQNIPLMSILTGRMILNLCSDLSIQRLIDKIIILPADPGMETDNGTFGKIYWTMKMLHRATKNSPGNDGMGHEILLFFSSIITFLS